jgi:hypothetical protein
MASPQLFIRRIVVEGDLSYDQRFFPGLNVVHAAQVGSDPRSSNQCGKTSLVELIQHGLGKQHDSKAKFHFAPIMDQLKTLWLEIETRNGVYAIQRSLQAIQGAARFYEGPYVPGIDETPGETVSVNDISHLLLNLVGIPEVSVNTRDGRSEPLSFPLLMRAFILHQEDSFAEILFKVQPDTRKTDIIGFLTGITPLERFPIEKDISEVMQYIQPLENYVVQVRKFLIENQAPSTVEAAVMVEHAEEKLDEARTEQRAIQQLIIDRESTERLGQTDLLRQRLLTIKTQIAELEQGFVGMKREEEQIIEVLASLRNDRNKSAHLQASTAQLSQIDFAICPRCLQDITAEMRERERTARCTLCNRPLLRISDSLPRRVTKTEDIDVQIDEAELLLAGVRKQVQENSVRLQRLREEQRESARDLEMQTAAYVSPAVDQLNAQASVISECQVALAKATDLLEQAQRVDELERQLDELRSRLAELQDKLREARKANSQRRESLRQIYGRTLEAVDFPDYHDVKIDSQTLLPIINDTLYVHYGTALKGLATVSYHLSLLSLALTTDTYFPTLLVIDSPNVGDLNEINHIMLLRYLTTLGKETGNAEDWQIILTTRLLPPELEPFVRETISRPDRMLLRKRA